MVWCTSILYTKRTKTTSVYTVADNIHITCGGGDQLRKKARARLVTSSRPTNEQLTGGKIEPAAALCVLFCMYLLVYYM